MRRPPLMLISLMNFNLFINLPPYLPPNDQFRWADFINGTVSYQNKQIRIPVPRVRIQINYISNHQQFESWITLNFMLNNKKIFHRSVFSLFKKLFHLPIFQKTNAYQYIQDESTYLIICSEYSPSQSSYILTCLAADANRRTTPKMVHRLPV